jgi:CrcB protein
VNPGILAVAVAAGGGVGAAVRLVVDSAITRRWRGEIALGTTVVNVAGSFLAGIVVGEVLAHGLDPTIRTIVVTGFCGGLTTWSSSMYETSQLLANRRVVAALGVGVGGLLASIGAAVVGLTIVGG